MRSIGVASRALDLLLQRVSDPNRKTFGKELREHGTVLADIAHSRAEIDQARLLVLAAARQIDLHGAKAAMKDIGISKVSFSFHVVSRAFLFARSGRLRKLDWTRIGDLSRSKLTSTTSLPQTMLMISVCSPSYSTKSSRQSNPSLRRRRDISGSASSIYVWESEDTKVCGRECSSRLISMSFNANVGE